MQVEIFNKLVRSEIRELSTLNEIFVRLVKAQCSTCRFYNDLCYILWDTNNSKQNAVKNTKINLILSW